MDLLYWCCSVQTLEPVAAHFRVQTRGLVADTPLLMASSVVVLFLLGCAILYLIFIASITN